MEIKINMCFPVSKQALIVNDTEEAGHSSALRFKFQEFLEFICRVAYQRFRGTEMEGIDLSQKVKFMLD
jgi:hypothetical protein